MKLHQSLLVGIAALCTTSSMYAQQTYTELEQLTVN